MTHDQCEVSEIEAILNKLLCNDCFSSNSDEIKISDLLIRRKELLNKLFVCSEENIERLCEISNLLHLKREMLMDEFKKTCRKLLEVCDMQKDTHLTKFSVETSLKIQIGNSHYELWQKNSEGKGNDLDMSELLCAYNNRHDCFRVGFDLQLIYCRSKFLSLQKSQSLGKTTQTNESALSPNRYLQNSDYRSGLCKSLINKRKEA